MHTRVDVRLPTNDSRQRRRTKTRLQHQYSWVSATDRSQCCALPVCVLVTALRVGFYFGTCFGPLVQSLICTTRPPRPTASNAACTSAQRARSPKLKVESGRFRVGDSKFSLQAWVIGGANHRKSHAHIHANTCSHKHTHKHTHTSTHKHMHMHAHIHAHVWMRTHMRTNAQARIHTRMHVYTHASAHTPTHACTHVDRPINKQTDRPTD